MPLLCVGEKRSPTQTDDDSDEDGPREETSFWQEAPDSIILHIFSFLQVQDLSHVAQTCKTWKRISFDESLWKSLMGGFLCLKECSLPPGKTSWRQEVQRFTNHRPSVLTETLGDHTDEVLHVSFSHDGKLFSTTSKDATLKIWTLGCPTTLKYNKDFRDLLGWDFTQYSCFNESDTMILVSSVKTTGYMDRRGYMAVLSLIHDFEILRIVTMDPSQLFGAWLDDTTFLGGSLEISLDRFATTVQIEAYDVPEIYSPLPRPSSLVVEGSSGQTLFTFSSETASLIKFLTVALIKSPESIEAKSQRNPDSLIQGSLSPEKILTDLSPSLHECYPDGPSCSYRLDMTSGETGYETESRNEIICSGNSHSNISVLGETSLQEKNSLEEITESPESCANPGDELEVQGTAESDSHLNRFCGEHKTFSLVGENKVKSSDYKQNGSSNQERILSGNTLCQSLEDRPATFGDRLEDLEVFCFSDTQDIVWSSKDKEDWSTSLAQSNDDSISSDIKAREQRLQQKNLIFVTGEFAVALHQLGFKNVPAYAKESVLSDGVTPMEDDNNPDSFMVVNYSNNDIHFVRRQQEPDKPDNLLDLFGHVTGLCLTADQRYLFINCRPWIGNVDRTDPWATPDLSPNIEIRIIDLVTLKDLGVRYIGHKGFSPSNMCCFVFLDVSDDYVASGSEDSLGYLWDKHYGALIGKFEHDSGVVNAVGFNPKNQEILITVSDDGSIKIWRSKHEANLFFDDSM